MCGVPVCMSVCLRVLPEVMTMMPCARGAEGKWQLCAGRRIRRWPVLGSACLPA